MATSEQPVPPFDFDDLPKAVRHLLTVTAERATLVANGALGILKDGQALAPAEVAAWHDKALAASTQMLFEAWSTIDESDLRLAGFWVCMTLVDQHLRQGEAGIALLRQQAHAAIERPSPAPGSST